LQRDESYVAVEGGLETVGLAVLCRWVMAQESESLTQVDIGLYLATHFEEHVLSITLVLSFSKRVDYEGPYTEEGGPLN
jgi:hypothetical protein